MAHLSNNTHILYNGNQVATLCDLWLSSKERGNYWTYHKSSNLSGIMNCYTFRSNFSEKQNGNLISSGKKLSGLITCRSNIEICFCMYVYTNTRQNKLIMPRVEQKSIKHLKFSIFAQLKELARRFILKS